MLRTLVVSFAGVLSTASFAADNTQRPADYAAGIQVDPAGGTPLVEITLPDAVYRTIVDPELRDIAVFNRADEAVPFALCLAPKVLPGAASSIELPVFELQAAKSSSSNEARIDLNTPSGTSVRIEASPSESSAAAHTQAHVIDARASEAPLRSIAFQWSSPDGASQASVRIEASDDLDRWTTVVAASTLLQVTAAGQELRRERIDLPDRAYQYLRVVRVDGGPALAIHSVQGESVSAQRTSDPIWIAADVQGSKDNAEWFFDAARIAPISLARVGLASDNASLRLRIESRADTDSAWRPRFSGEVYSIVADGQRRTSRPAQFVPTADRYWRIVKDAGSVSPAGAPSLGLGFHPARLQFLASGSGPYTLAFGSRRAAPSSAYPCDGLLADSNAPRDNLIGEAYLGERRTLGGDLALQAPPVATPVKRIVLWVVLVLGAASLIVMAVTLLKKVRTEGSDS